LTAGSAQRDRRYFTIVNSGEIWIIVAATFLEPGSNWQGGAWSSL
jgi:hypothetical protein